MLRPADPFPGPRELSLAHIIVKKHNVLSTVTRMHPLSYTPSPPPSLSDRIAMPKKEKKGSTKTQKFSEHGNTPVAERRASGSKKGADPGATEFFDASE
jgi:hypothetical protein